jgi:hypothetical protein
MGQHTKTEDEDTPFEGGQAVSTRLYARPFGMSGRNQMMKEEALRVLPRQECFDRGYITVQDLDDEELVHGRCRDRTGKIPKINGKTELIPREKYDAMVAEHELRYKQRLRTRLDSMIDVMVSIAEDDTVEPRDRLEAAKYIFERTAGKTPETVTVNVKHAPWEELLSHVAGIAPMSRAEHRELGVGIVDAEVVEDGEAKGQEEASSRGETHTTFSGASASTSIPNDDAAVSAPVPTDAASRPADEPMSYWTEGDIHTHADSPPEPERNYGRRADEKRSYAQQAHDAQNLAKRRKEAKAKIQNAKKSRKIARALGADAIDDPITEATVSEDGSVTFEQR